MLSINKRGMKRSDMTIFTVGDNNSLTKITNKLRLDDKGKEIDIVIKNDIRYGFSDLGL